MLRSGAGLDFLPAEPAVLLADLLQRHRHLGEAFLPALGRCGVVFARRVPVAIDAQFLDRLAKIVDPLAVDVELLLVALFILGEVLVARIMRQIDRKTGATAGRAIADATGIDKNDACVGGEFAQPAGTVEPHPAASDDEIIACDISIQLIGCGPRTQGGEPTGTGWLHMDRHDFHSRTGMMFLVRAYINGPAGVMLEISRSV